MVSLLCFYFSFYRSLRSVSPVSWLGDAVPWCVVRVAVCSTKLRPVLACPPEKELQLNGGEAQLSSFHPAITKTPPPQETAVFQDTTHPPPSAPAPQTPQTPPSYPANPPLNKQANPPTLGSGNPNTTPPPTPQPPNARLLVSSAPYLPAYLPYGTARNERTNGVTGRVVMRGPGVRGFMHSCIQPT
jgi:hypothetical protein